MTCPEVRGLLDVEVKPTAKLVLLAFALRAGADGRAWPSVSRLSADTGLSPRAVRYAIETLVDAGHIDLEKRPGRSTIVTVTVAPLAMVPPVAPRHVVHPPRHVVPRTVARGAPRRNKEELQEVATPGSTTPWPAAASTTGNGTGTGNGNGPAAGESWGEYRERGGQ